jgi:hypothetical protein
MAIDVKTGVAAPSAPDHVGDLIDELEREVLHDYAPPHVKRDAHPKMHGCVQAILEVDEGLPSELKVGVFDVAGNSPPYLAWVRFSNAFKIQHDLEYEARGMAVKLLGFQKHPQLLRDVCDGTQDFLFATHDAFFLRDLDIPRYREFAEAAATSPGRVFTFFRKNGLFSGFVAMLRSAGAFGPAVSNPLAVTYYSQTPYKFGEDKAVKLRARPITPDMKPPLVGRLWWFVKALLANGLLAIPPKARAELWCDKYLAPRNYLRHALGRFLATRAATFRIEVQFQADGMPIDDPTEPWSQLKSCFKPVATLTIPRQVFWPAPGMPDNIKDATARMMELGETMSFNPWHSLEEHEPLGGINLARKRIYNELSRFRHEKNKVATLSGAQDNSHLVVPTKEQYERLRDQVQFGLIEAPRRHD